MKSGPIYAIKDLPRSERPRERLEKQGASSLSEAELLAIVLRTGSRFESVLDMSKRILRELNLKELSQASLNQLKSFRGINTAKASQLIACFELAKRVHSYTEEDDIFLDSSQDVVKLLKAELDFMKREHFIGLYLDSRNKLLRKETISIGGLNSSIVHPRELFKIALQESANSIILVHNHPSGITEPSKDDIEITNMLIKSSKIMGIDILDHVIIGEKGFTSMAEKGIVDFY